jgi:6-phosphofructokinase
LGATAVNLILNNEFEKAVGIKDNRINAVDLHRAVEEKGTVVDPFYRLIRILT